MGSFGMPEIIAIGVLALILFGPSRLPQFGKSLGESITAFKNAMSPPSEASSAPKKKTKSKKR